MFRIRFITHLTLINEYIFFYPKLKKIYKNNIKRKDPVIFDVGSNKGQSIDFFLKIFDNPVIYGFEPNKELFDGLIRRYSSNKNIKLFNCGISDTNGKLNFNETVTHETSTFEELNYDSEYLKYKSKILGVKPEEIIKRSYDVDVISLHEFIKKNSIKDIDILKIDTEGHEYKCLLGLFGGSSINIKYIQLEQHNDDMYSERVPVELIDQLLDRNGFKIFEVVKHQFGDFVEKIYVNKNI